MAAEIRIKIKNVDQIINFLKTRPAKTKEELNRAVEKTVLLIERGTKQRAPVDTGRMRSSVHRRTFKRLLEGEVVAGVRYAIYVHEGTKFMRARPFMGDAIRASEGRIQKFFVQAMANVLKK